MKRPWLKGDEKGGWEEFASFESWFYKKALIQDIEEDEAEKALDVGNAFLYSLFCELLDKTEPKEANEPKFNRPNYGPKQQ